VRTVTCAGCAAAQENDGGKDKPKPGEKHFVVRELRPDAGAAGRG